MAFEELKEEKLRNDTLEEKKQDAYSYALRMDVDYAWAELSEKYSVEETIKNLKDFIAEMGETGWLVDVNEVFNKY